MKHLLIIFILSSTINCFSQIKTEFLVGMWKFENTTDHQDSIVESSVKEYDFIIHKNENFKIKSKEYSISGKWKLLNSTLVLVGKRSDIEETNTEKIIIYSLSEDKLSIELNTENKIKSLMNLKRLKK